MERSANTQVDQLRGAGAPRAPMPGMGVGNVPFSPGMASGQLGPQHGPPQPPPGPPPMSFGPSGGPPPGFPPPGGGPPGGPPPMVPGMGGGVDPMLMTQTYFSYMSELMHAITGAYKRAAAQPGLPWGY